MKAVFSIGAALRSEKNKTAKRINQCNSFTKLCIEAEELTNVSSHSKNTISFSCQSFGIVEEHSSSNWGDVFSYKADEGENQVIIRAKEAYIMGPAIPGYQ